MMKVLSLLLLLTANFISAQSQDENIIYATDRKNVNLFFQSPIMSAIVGSNTYSFGFNREDKSKYGILRAMEGPESNLLVTTENGNIYSFLIRYKKDVDKLNHFITESESIGNLQKDKKIIETVRIDSINKPNEVVNDIQVNDYEISKEINVLNPNNKTMEMYCEGEIEKQKYYKRYYAENNKIFIKLKNIAYDHDELYFTIIIDNQSTLDYDIEELNFYIIAKNKSRRTSTQRIGYKPIYIHKLPTRVGANSKEETVFVFKKFSINKEKVLQIYMSEFKGERNVELEIQHTDINNPN